jgi:hypothetical protein
MWRRVYPEKRWSPLEAVWVREISRRGSPDCGSVLKMASMGFAFGVLLVGFGRRRLPAWRSGTVAAEVLRRR